MSDWVSTCLDLIGKKTRRISDGFYQIEDKKVCFFSSDTEPELTNDASIVIHEDVFRSSPEKVISRMRSVLGMNERTVFARKTKAKKNEKRRAKAFVDRHHLLGYGGGYDHYGLLKDDELVAVAVFSKIRKMKYENPPYDSVELERFCSLKNTTVVGGLDKLIKTYLKNHQTDDIVTYIDKEWSSGKGFLQLGFEMVEETSSLSFLVNKTNWKREPIKGDRASRLTKTQYVIKNKGNLKLRLKVN